MDTTPVPARHGGIIGDSVIGGPPVAAIELHMLSGRGNPIEQAVDVSDNLREISKIAYSYYIICTLLVIVLLSVNKSTKYSNLAVISKQIYRNMCRIFEAMLDQENHQPNSNHIKLLWTINCIAIFVFVFCFLLNLMQTSMVKLQWPPTLDRFSDFLQDPQFMSSQLYMPKKWWFYDYMRTADDGTEQRTIYERMAKRGDCMDTLDDNCSFLQGQMLFDLESAAKISLDIAKRVENSSIAMIGADIIIKGGRVAMCYVRPQTAEKLHYSPSLASDILT